MTQVLTIRDRFIIQSFPRFFEQEMSCWDLRKNPLYSEETSLIKQAERLLESLFTILKSSLLPESTNPKRNHIAAKTFFIFSKSSYIMKNFGPSKVYLIVKAQDTKFHDNDLFTGI